MIDKRTSALRDPAKPSEHYDECIELLRNYVETSLEKGPPLFAQVAEYYVRMARAAYSAGKSVKECRDNLEKSSKYQVRFFQESLGGKMVGIGNLERYLEWFAASDLTRGAQGVVTAFRKLEVTGIRPWQESLMTQLCAVFAGDPIVQEKAQMDEIRRIKEYAALPTLFRAVSDGNVAECGAALESFLTTSWGPSADRAARRDLKAPYPLYTGKWSFFSAAVCMRIGQVPQLSKKALQYVPVDLLQP